MANKVFKVGDYGSKESYHFIEIDDNKVYKVGDYGSRDSYHFLEIDGLFSNLQLVTILMVMRIL